MDSWDWLNNPWQNTPKFCQLGRPNDGWQDDSPVSRRSKIIICATFLAEAVFATIAKGSVWLSSFCALSRVPWSDEIEGKVEKRARGLLACQVSECTSRCGFSSMENLSFSMTWPIRRDMIRYTRNFYRLYYATWLLLSPRR